MSQGPVAPGLPDPSSVPDPFVALDRIAGMGETRLVASTGFCGEAWMLLEAAAQAACAHLRAMTDFSELVFLLCVEEAALDPGVEGPLRVEAELLGRSSGAARYRVRILGERAGKEAASATLMVGRRPYESAEQAERLSAHYREVFLCLCTCATRA